MEEQLRKRLVTAAILIVLVFAFGLFASVSVLGRWALQSFILLVLLLAQWEFLSLQQDASSYREKLLAQVRGALPLLAVYVFSSLFFFEPRAAVFQTPQLCYSSALIIGLALCLVHACEQGRSELEVFESAWREATLAFVFFIIGGAALLSVALSPYCTWLFLWLLLVVCVNDSCAYFVGKKFGRNKMAPALSPNKTLEGALAGFLGGVLVGILSSSLLPAAFSWWALVAFSFLTVLLAQCGDLIKSFVKRKAGRKDSGHLLPGHGGVLDRVDGIVMAAPVLLLILARGV